ncbi:MAG: hypothetical protein ABIR24_06140 [Verrucomicrobiota bacterium]
MTVAKCFIILFLVAGMLLPATPGNAVTVSELRNTPNLTPETFASYFADFEFKFHEEVQDHDTFLASKSGDCDDYSTLAADILGRNGYTTRLIAVRMKGETHVVCYVNETKSYLDYNYRKDEKKTIPCNSSITEIARKVSQSFGRGWIATYQFTFSQGVKRLVQSIITNRSTEKTS